VKYSNNTSIKAEKSKLSQRIGRKVMGLRHLYRLLLPLFAMTAKLPAFKMNKSWQFFILNQGYKLSYHCILYLLDQRKIIQKTFQN